MLEGAIDPKKIAKQAKALGFPAAAITDRNGLYGSMAFSDGCKGEGVQPIVGAMLGVVRPGRPSNAPAVHDWIALYAQDAGGYDNICALVSMAHLDRPLEEVPHVTLDMLEGRTDGVIALTAGGEGAIARLFAEDQPDAALAYADRLQALFPDRLYVEICRRLDPIEGKAEPQLLDLAYDRNLPLVATNPTCFAEPEFHAAHDVMLCIADGAYVETPDRRTSSPDAWMKPAAEMKRLFEDLPEALANTLVVAQRCAVMAPKRKPILPSLAGDIEGEGIMLRDQSIAGLEARLEKAGIIADEARQPYFERLKFEMDIIIQMGFPGYFLIVADFIKWAKDHDIPVGPGRGSGAGSLVAWALTITDLDPLQLGLLFERFLNPERVSMPDFDIDFCMEDREKVIAYVADNYGREAVSQIVTFGTMAARAVVRDVARAQGKSFGLADKLSKLIPGDPGMTLEKALDSEPLLKEFLNDDEEAAEIWEMAVKLEGIARQTGKHAGGVVIAPTKLTDFSPTACEPDGTGLVTQFDKNDVEEAGLVKFDFLGLRTLTIIDWALETINAKQEKLGLPPVDINHIPLDDPASYKLLKEAKTTAVFQLESRGMKDLIRRLQPDNIEDMIALVALFRPGPLESGMVDDFINRKHGRAKVAYPHPDFQHDNLKEILEPTYGVIVYQEQVMQIAQALAGYTLGGADMLRRAMGKKKPEEMAKQRDIFREGAISVDVDPELAMKIFDLVEKFAGYGFNKSHSAAYAVVSYQTLWLKTHYPAPFMAAVLTSDMQNTDKVVTFIEECREMGLTLVLPDVNQSDYGFTVNDDGAIVYGLGAVKGVGEGPIEAIKEARAAGGNFRDLFDFCQRVDGKRINKRVLEALVRCGAFDNLEFTAQRAVLMASIEDAIKSAGQAAANEAAGMFDLFGEAEEEAASTTDVYERHRRVRDWSLKERLQGEKDTLGLYVTGHPFDEYEAEVRQLVPTRLSHLQESKSPQKLAGLVVDMRLMKNKRGDTMCFVTLDDRSGRMEVALFADIYDQVRETIAKDKVLVLEAIVSHDDYSGGLKATGRSATEIAQARLNFARALKVKVTASDAQQSGLCQQLKGLLQPLENGCPVVLSYSNEVACCDIRLDDQWCVNPTDEQLQELKYAFGENAVELVFS